MPVLAVFVAVALVAVLAFEPVPAPKGETDWDAAAIQASGYGPGDAYIGLWDELAELKNDQRQISKRLTKPALKQATKTFLAARYDELRDKAIEVFTSILPYERPKLAMVKYEGDGTGEIIDLKVLPDDKFKQLKEIALLLTGGTHSGAAGPAAGDTNRDPLRGGAAPGGGGAPKDSAKLRKAPRAANRKG
jgi:hypothetical protein